MTIHGYFSAAKFARFAVVAAGLVAFGSGAAMAATKTAKDDSATFVQRGMLTCSVAAGVGMVVVSSKALDCSLAVAG